MQYIRFKEEYSFFVQMFTSVIIELIPLMMAFVMFTIIFSLISIIMQNNLALILQKVPLYFVEAINQIQVLETGI